MVEIEHINKDDVLDYVGEVIAGLGRIERKTGNSERAQVIKALLSGAAQLWRISVDGVVRAWTISAVYVDYLTNEKTLHLWKMWGGGMALWVEQGLELWDKKAKEIGCDSIAMVSTRAWDQMLKKRGFENVPRYVKKVST